MLTLFMPYSPSTSRAAFSGARDAVYVGDEKMLVCYYKESAPL
jgi:hypothetical protein